MKKSLVVLLAICGINAASASNRIPDQDTIPCQFAAQPAGPDHELCAGESVVLGLNHLGLFDTSAYVFAWTPSDGLDNTGKLNPTASPAQSTNYFLTINDTVSGCTFYDTVSVLVKQPATLMFFPPGPHYICAGQQVTLTGGYGFSNYNWSGPQGAIEGRVVQVSGAGMYRLSATDAQGCFVQADTFELIVRTPLPLLTNPSGIKKLCTGQTAQLSAANGFIAYNWHTPTGTVGGRFTTASTPGNYYVTATDANSCLSTSAVVQVQVNNPAEIAPLPLPDSLICPEESITLTAPDGFTNYFWVGPSGTIQGKNITINQPGSYQLKALDDNLCLSVAQAVELVAVNAADLMIDFGDNTFFCSDGNKFLSADSGFTQYQWSSPSGSAYTREITANLPGLYSLTALDHNGCLSSADNLTLHNYPTSIIGLNTGTDTLICRFDTLQLNPEPGFYTYTWESPAGTLIQQNIAVADEGMYRVSAFDSNGCRSFSSFFHLQHIPLNRPTILLNGRDTLCPGDRRILSSAAGFTAQQWITPAGASFSETFETGIGGTYALNAIDSNGCSVSSLPLTLHENLPFKPEIIGNKTSWCTGEFADLSTEQSYSSYQWSNGLNAASIQVTSDCTISLQAINSWGCTGYSDTLEIAFVEKPSASFLYSQPINTPGIQFINQSTNADNWLWDFGDGQTSEEQHPAHIYSSRGVWSVVLIVANQCGADTVFRELKLDTTLSVPNDLQTAQHVSIYPNPGSDYMFIKGLDSQNQTVFIHDLSGRIIYSNTFKFTGTDNFAIPTSELPAGAYFIRLGSAKNGQVLPWLKR